MHRTRVHYSNSLTEAIQFLAEAGLLASSPEPLLNRITHSSYEVDKRFLRLEGPLTVPQCRQIDLPISGQHPLPVVPVAAAGRRCQETTRIPRAAPRSLSLVVSFATSWPPLSILQFAVEVRLTPNCVQSRRKWARERGETASDPCSREESPPGHHEPLSTAQTPCLAPIAPSHC